MKTSITFFSFLILLQTADAKCNTMGIGYYNEKGFGISFGGGGSKAGYYDENTINVPLTINGEQACYKKKTAFKMASEKKGEKLEESKIVISPMKAEFENIPSPHQKQYIFVEKNNDKTLTKFHTMSFICAGEIPISIEAISSSAKNIPEAKPDNATVKTSSTFATGAAAENLKFASGGANSSQETFDMFTKLYKEKTNKELKTDTPCCTTYHAPSILSDTSIYSLSTVERKIASTFITNASNVPNGCSNDFSESMKNYQLENYVDNESLADFKISTTFFKKDIVFEWKQ